MVDYGPGSWWLQLWQLAITSTGGKGKGYNPVLGRVPPPFFSLTATSVDRSGSKEQLVQGVIVVNQKHMR